MTDTRRRVKVYTLNEDRQWDDRGTGHVSSGYVERLKGMSLLVRAESDGSLLLESKINPNTAYQKQQEDEKFLTDLFAQLTDEATDEEKRQELVNFLKEFCAFSQTLQPQNRDAFFKTLSNMGILPALEVILGMDDTQVRSAATDIFSYLVEYNPSMVREFVMQEAQQNDDVSKKLTEQKITSKDILLINL
ncbi:PPP4R3A isoform 9, partial [Pan troglodytes]